MISELHDILQEDFGFKIFRVITKKSKNITKD